MTIIMNTESIDKLLAGRIIVDNYKTLVDGIDNEKLKNKYRTDTSYEMAKLGFRYDSLLKPDKILINFALINEVFNIVEFDKNYCFRHINKPEIYPRPIMEVEDFCVNGSGCIDRGYIPCTNTQNISFVDCYYQEPAITKFIKFNESEIAYDYTFEADKLGIPREGLYIPHPMMLIAHHKLNPTQLTPKNCIGLTIKISEPRFDIFWGLDRFFDGAEFQWNLRQRLQENADSNM